MDLNSKLLILESAFSPSAPIDQQALFAGRISQLLDVMDAINRKGQHVVLFGERGVGKTSLAKVLEKLRMDTITASVNCESTMQFADIWRKVFRQIQIQETKNGIGFSAQSTTSTTTLDQYLSNEVTPDDVRHLFSQIKKAFIVIDELDRLSHQETTTLLADTIKTLSDHAVDVTILLVGVADSVDTLIAQHASVERALVQVRMPRMSPIELAEIIKNGLSRAQMQIDSLAQNRIVTLSQGLPHYTHLLTLNASVRAVRTNRNLVTIEDVRVAIDSALSKAQETIINAYHKATNSPRDNLYEQVLLSCALADTDELGYFAAIDVKLKLSAIMHKHYEISAFSQHLKALCETASGSVLQRTGFPRRYRFRFNNPLMQPYVIMNGIRKALITDDLKPVAIKQLQQPISSS